MIVKELTFEKKSLYGFLIIWFFLFLFLGIAFSGFTTSLAAEGMAEFQAHIYDYVYISGIRISGNSNASSVNYSFLDHEMSATVMAPTCDGYVEYKIDIVNTTPYKAFITAQGITSQINGSGNPTTTLSAEFTDVTLNSTYINPHSTKTVTLRIKNNCSGSDEQVTIKPNFEYSLYKYFDLTVNSVPNDATVKRERLREQELLLIGYTKEKRLLLKQIKSITMKEQVLTLWVHKIIVKPLH